MTTGRPQALGIDIGGSGIKGALVDVGAGNLVTQRQRIATPRPSSVEAVAQVIDDLTHQLDWTGDVGVTFPAVIKNGIARTAANMDKSWIGTDIDAAFTKASGCSVTVLNDADAAGVAEARFGAGKAVGGVVLLLTFGTGIGSALLLDGRLVPNTELGHVELAGYDAETRAAASVKDRQNMSYRAWSVRVQDYLRYLERLFTPDLFIVGGEVSKQADKWVPLLELDTPVEPAQLRGDAGIVGAAVLATEAATP